MAWVAFAFAASAACAVAEDSAAPISPPGTEQRDLPNEDPDVIRQRLVELQRTLTQQQLQIESQRQRLEQLEAAKVLPPGGGGAAAQPASRVALPVRLPQPSQTPNDLYEPLLPEGPAPGANDPPFSPSPEGQNPAPRRIGVGGQYRLMFNASNFEYHSPTISDDQKSQTFFNQRFRTWLSVNPNENVEGYLQVQIGHVLWGTDYEFPKTYAPPFAVAGDTVGIQLRRGWLAYQTAGLGRLRAGIQDWQDSFGQVLASSDWDFNVGGLSWTRDLPSLGDANLLLGIFSLTEGDVQHADDAQLLTLDLGWKGEGHRSFGVAAYYLPDAGTYSYPTVPAYRSAWDVWLGVRGGLDVGPLPVGAFFILNPGERKDLAGPTYHHEGYALKLEAGPLPIGSGKWSVQTLFSSGMAQPNDTHSQEFRTIAQSARDNFGAEGYWSYLVITSPQGASDVNDLGVSLQNRGLGLFTVQTKYEYPIFQRLSGTIACGWLRSATTNPTSGATEIGTELANIFTYDFGGGLKADFGASVLFTGDFYKPSPQAPQPDDLWEAFARLQLEF